MDQSRFSKVFCLTTGIKIVINVYQVDWSLSYLKQVKTSVLSNFEIANSCDDFLVAFFHSHI